MPAQRYRYSRHSESPHPYLERQRRDRAARAAGFRFGDNPVDLIGDALPRQKKSERHHAALPYADVSSFIGKLHDGQGAPITKLAFEFLILTAVRTRGAQARWDEVDWRAKTAYRRGQLLAKRFQLMGTWAAFPCPAATVDSIGGA